MALRYDFRFDAELRALSARVCFEGQPPRSLACTAGWARAYLRQPQLETGTDVRALPIERGRIVLGAAPPDSCVRYSVDLQAAASELGALRAERRGDALLSNLALWLFRPHPLLAGTRAHARIDLPAGMRVSVPWPRDEGGFVLDESALASFGYGVVGRYEVEHLQVAGAEIEIAVLDGLSPETRRNVAPWIESAALMASLPGARFPSPRALVAVVPTEANDDPVGFGHVVRGGGVSIGVFLRDEAELDALKADWVAVHEFAHLWHPFVARSDAWLSEGLATYYQEVLRARAGVQSELRAYQRLWDGTLHREGASGSLVRESAAMFENFSFRRVYWAGAAFALMADVELRRRSQGRVSLDHVLDQLASCCARAHAPQPARELIARMDAIAGGRIFGELYERVALGRELPELFELYARLGLEVENGEVRVVEGAPDAEIREALMRRDPRIGRRVAEALPRVAPATNTTPFGAAAAQ